MGAVETYLDELKQRIAASVEAVGIYVGGSYALGAYEAGRSDLDVAVVSAGPLADDEKEALVAEGPRARVRYLRGF